MKTRPIADLEPERRPSTGLTIRAKMVLLVSLIIATISGFIYLYFPLRTQARIIRSVRAEAQSVSRLAAFSIAPSLVFGDRETGAETLRSVETIAADLVYLVVHDASGKTFVAIREDFARHHPHTANGLSALLPADGVFQATAPIHHGGRQIGSVCAGFNLRPALADIRQMRGTIATVSLIVFLFGLAATFGISTLVTRPIAQVVQTAEAIARGNWEHRAPVSSRDEVGQLASSFNLMLDRLAEARRDLEEWNDSLERRVAERTVSLEQEIQERQRGEEELKQLENEFRQAQKMEALGRLAGGVAHDFNNLLTTIMGYSELLLAELPEGTAREEVDEIRKAGERAARLTQQLLAFSRKQVVEPRVLNLNAIVADTEKMVRRLIGEDVVIKTKLDPSVGPIRADRGQLEQVLLNIVVNARDAMERGGVLTIRTANERLDEKFVREHRGARPGRHTMIAIADTGCGMDDETLKKIYDPFFTTKDPTKGTGLGMATVYGIVKQAGGYIWIDTELGKGTTVSIWFPQVDAVEDRPDSLPVAAPPRGGSETVLLVEDEEGVRRLIRGVLESHGYKVLAASDPARALSIAEGTDTPIDLLVTDLVMRGMSGRELADRLLRARPETRLLYVSGYTEDTALLHGVRTSGRAFLCKPFPPDVLLKRVREVLDETPPLAVSSDAVN